MGGTMRIEKEETNSSLIRVDMIFNKAMKENLQIQYQTS
jgi:hypothetical protein